MITSGYLIGQIIDEFSLLGDRIKLRNRLGLFDLTMYVENFFKEIINIIDDGKLVNLNSTRSNEPGLDLGDINRKIAYQVTSDKTGAKVVHTLQRITTEQRNNYSKFIVLIVGEKQQTYDAVVTALNNRGTTDSDDDKNAESNELNKIKIHPDIIFDIDSDIIDLTDIARKIVGLQLDKIQKLNQLVQSQMAKVRVELEIPDADGKYETSGYDKWESLAEPKIGDGSKFAAWEEKFENIKHESLPKRSEEIKKSIEELSQKLYVLPRITREFLAMLYERSEFLEKRFSGTPSLYLHTVTNSYHDAQGAQIELDLLSSQLLISIDTENGAYDRPKPFEIGLDMCSNDPNFYIMFYTYVKEENLSFRKIIGTLDFSSF